MKLRHSNIGSVSSGTMRPEDLIPTLISELQRQKPLHREHRKLIREIQDSQRRMKSPAYYENEQASWDLDALFDALDCYSPPYFSFGSHPGDGADFGWWLSECFAEDFDGLKVSDTSEVPRGFTGEVMHVNDHGNLTLYAYSRGRAREVWAIV
jgi:hypothetical protein